MPKERRFHTERSDIKPTSNFYKSKEKKKQQMIPLARKSTSILSIKSKERSPTSLRRKDLKSLMYLHNNITEDQTQVGLKSCLSSQRQCDKIKMKVKFYLKKDKDGKLGHPSRTKSAHSFNKKNTKSLDLSSPKSQQKTKTKFNKMRMAGDIPCKQNDVKQKKQTEKSEHKSYINSSSLKRNLARTMKNLIIEKSKQLSDTSLSHQHESFKLKHNNSYSSITKYQKFKNRLNKSNLKSHLFHQGTGKHVENTSSRTLFYSFKNQMLPVKHETRLDRSLGMPPAKKIHRVSSNVDHGNKNVKIARELAKHVTKKEHNFPKNNLSAVFYQDICVTGKKLKLWKNNHTKRRPISLQIGRKQTPPSRGSDHNKPSKIKKVQTFCGHKEKTSIILRKNEVISLDSLQFPDRKFSDYSSTFIRLTSGDPKHKHSKSDCFIFKEMPKKGKRSIHFNEANKYAQPKHEPNASQKVSRSILRPTKKELWDDLLNSSNRARHQEGDTFQKFPRQKEHALVIKDTLENLHSIQKKMKKIEWSDSCAENSKNGAHKTSRRSRSTLAIQSKLTDKISRIFSKMSIRKNKSMPKIKLQTKLLKQNQSPTISKECHTSKDYNTDDKGCKMKKEDKECACNIHDANNPGERPANRRDFAYRKSGQCQTSDTIDNRYHYNEFITNKSAEWTQTGPINEKGNMGSSGHRRKDSCSCEKSQICLSPNYSNYKNGWIMDHGDINCVGNRFSNKELRLNPDKMDYRIIRPDVLGSEHQSQNNSSKFGAAPTERGNVSNLAKQFSDSTNFPENYFDLDKHGEGGYPKFHLGPSNSFNMNESRYLDKTVKGNGSIQVIKGPMDRIPKKDSRELPYSSKNRHKKGGNYNQEGNIIQLTNFDDDEKNYSLREDSSQELRKINYKSSERSITEQQSTKRYSTTDQQHDDVINVKTTNAPINISKSKAIKNPSSESKFSKNMQPSRDFAKSSISVLSATNSAQQIRNIMEQESNMTLKEVSLELLDSLTRNNAEEKSLQTQAPGVSIKVPPIKPKFRRESQMKHKSTIKKLWYKFLETPRPPEKLPPTKNKNLKLLYDGKTPIDSLDKRKTQNTRPVKRNKNSRDAASAMQPIRSNYQLKIQNAVAQQNTNMAESKSRTWSTKNHIESRSEKERSNHRKPRMEHTGLRSSKSYEKTEKSNKRTGTNRLHIKKRNKSSQDEPTTFLEKIWSILVTKRKRVDRNRRKVKYLENYNLEKCQSTERKPSQCKSIHELCKQKRSSTVALAANETTSRSKTQDFLIRNEFRTELIQENNFKNWGQKFGNMIHTVLPWKDKTENKTKKRLPQRRKDSVEVRSIQTRLDRQTRSEHKSTGSSKKFVPEKLHCLSPDQIISEIRNVNTSVKRFCISPETKLKNIEPLIKSINPNKVHVQIKNKRKELHFINDEKPKAAGDHPCACSLPSDKKLAGPKAVDKFIRPECPKSHVHASMRDKLKDKDRSRQKDTRASLPCVCEHRKAVVRKLSDTFCNLRALFPNHNDCECPAPVAPRPRPPGRLHISNRPTTCLVPKRPNPETCECISQTAATPGKVEKKNTGNICVCSLKNVCQCFDQPLECICKCREALIKRKPVVKKKPPKPKKKKEPKKKKPKKILAVLDPGGGLSPNIIGKGLCPATDLDTLN
ncbi:uncharacterized protein LOC113502693 [Trichoplusia ni]|uniref:Uncharacterized protein LOC113502693 n=1 Tax=Trichoplusia ni TaxID=7111 RepID=A0A7E5WJ26_TRINI|nr:uncharacterized protein LOC113502693 [Trichoplusia ni]